MATAPLTPPFDVREQQALHMRRFNRFYTRQIGLLNEGLLNSPFSLTEVRTLYELAHRERSTAVELCKELGLDAGYLSRILRKFERQRLIEKNVSRQDGRQSLLSLTQKGRKVFHPLEARSTAQVSLIIGKLPPAQRENLVGAMQTIESILAPGSAERKSADGKSTGRAYVLRSHRPGDMGWVVQRHGALYAQEYDWNEQFEALVAEIVAHFLRAFDAKREACWIAERDGENVGCVFLVKHPERPGVAKLRLLVVEPTARGLGIGRRLVDECVRFATHAGYHTITLWTNSVLLAARRIYEAAGFALMSEDPHHSFGHDLVAQTWELKL